MSVPVASRGMAYPAPPQLWSLELHTLHLELVHHSQDLCEGREFSALHSLLLVLVGVIGP